MPRRYTMADLWLRSQRRADMENDPSISKLEGYSLMSEQYGEAYEIVAMAGFRYFEYSTQFTTTTNGYLDEPVDHLSTVDTLELVLDENTGRCIRLLPIGAQEHARWSGRTGVPRRYDMIDDRFYLYPKPPAGRKITLRYVPQPPDLMNFNDTDVVDIVTPSGLAYLIWGTAVKMLSKSRADVTLAITERDRLGKQLNEWATYRAMNQRPRIYVEEDDELERRGAHREGSWLFR